VKHIVCPANNMLKIGLVVKVPFKDADAVKKM
jgi:hypothetical protein